MDEVIGVTNGYGCGNRRKSGTVGYLLNQSSDEPSTTTTGGGEALLRRQLSLPRRFFLASQAGGLLPSASVKSLSIIGRNGGEGGPPYFNGKGGIVVSQPLLYNSLSPNMITNEDRELRRKGSKPFVLIGTIEERKRMVSPFAQGTSSENNVGDRVRTRWLRLLSVGSSLDMEIDPDRDRYIEKWILIWFQDL
jgi:hypothetical protein